jgi:iron complex outermembrane receptor protein
VYWSEFDLANYLTFDLFSVDVSKGYSSALLPSSNGIAGVVNIRTSKPQKPLEFRAKFTTEFDRELRNQGWVGGLSVGTKQKLFYLQAQAVGVNQDFFTLSSKFTPGRYQPSGKRVNSDYENKRLNFIAGFTPNDDIDIMLGIINQRYKKGQPFDAVTDADYDPRYNIYSWPRFWRWPEYETDRYYLNGTFKLSEKANLKVVGYYDKHIDTSQIYNEPELLTTLVISSYDEYGAGGQAIFDYEFDEFNKLSISAGFRKTSHKGLEAFGGVGPDVLTAEYIVNHTDFAAEYTVRPIDPLSVVLGVTYTLTKPDVARRMVGDAMEDVDGRAMDRQSLFSYQVGVFHDLDHSNQLYFTYARKNRTPSMEQRFSRDRNGNINGLNLKNEKADHLEFGYRGYPLDFLKLSSNIFYSVYADKIDYGPNSTRINLNKVVSSGAEIEAEVDLGEYLFGGITVSYLNSKPKGVPFDASLTMGSPKFTSSAYLVITPIEGLSITPQVYMRSSFYNDTDPSADNVDGAGFGVVDLKAVYEWGEHYSIEAGLKNVFDKNYYFTVDSPLAGRTFYIGLNANF